MANLNKLPAAEEKYRQMSIAHDITNREREVNKEKMQEAKHKNEDLKDEDLSVKFTYIIKGPP